MKYLLSFDLLNNDEVFMKDINSMKKSVLGFFFTFFISAIFFALNYSVLVGFFQSQTSLDSIFGTNLSSSYNHLHPHIFLRPHADNDAANASFFLEQILGSQER